MNRLLVNGDVLETADHLMVFVILNPIARYTSQPSYNSFAAQILLRNDKGGEGSCTGWGTVRQYTENLLVRDSHGFELQLLEDEEAEKIRFEVMLSDLKTGGSHGSETC